MHFISIIGPTAIGKTKLGVAVSKVVGGEVISVDSLQCYKAGSIVTAKVGNEEADGVAHYLVGYLQAYEEPNDFVAQAIDKIEEIANCGHMPVLVGGSTSLTIPLLLAASERGFQPSTILLWSPILSLQPRIEERVDEMIGSGLLDELRELKRLEKEYLGTPNFEKGVWKAIGYKELYPCLEALDGDENHDLLRECLTSMKQNTVDYAITQLRWMQQTLIPLLAQLQVPSASLRVNGDAVWKDEVEIPALRMVNGFRNNAAPAKEISLVAPLKLSNSSKRPTICVL
jgi:tRNA A37 N6-isopentenylltransferase MiaA